MIGYLLGFITLSIITCLLYKDIKYGIWFIISFLPIYLLRITVFGIPVTILELGIIAIFLLWVRSLWQVSVRWSPHIKKRIVYIISFLTGYKSSEYQRYYQKEINQRYAHIRLWVYIFILGATFGLCVSHEVRSALGIYKAYFIEPFLLFSVIVHVIKSKKDYIKTLYALGINVVVIGAVGLYQHITQNGLWVEAYHGITNVRITSLYQYPNAVSLLVAPITGTYLAWFLNKLFKKNIQNRYEVVYGLLVIVSGIGSIIGAQSEGAMIALLGAGALWGLLYGKWTRLFTISIFCVVTLVTMLTPSIHPMLIERATFRDFSGTIRRHTYSETIDMLSDHAIFGAGLAGYQHAMRPYHVDNVFVGDIMQPVEIFLYPHNIILNFWSEIGLIGLFGFIALCVQYVLNVIRSYSKEYALPLFIGLCVLLIHGLVDVPYFKNDLSVLFWVLFGLSLVLYVTKEKATEMSHGE